MSASTGTGTARIICTEAVYSDLLRVRWLLFAVRRTETG